MMYKGGFLVPFNGMFYHCIVGGFERFFTIFFAKGRGSVPLFRTLK